MLLPLATAQESGLAGCDIYLGDSAFCRCYLEGFPDMRSALRDGIIGLDSGALAALGPVS